MPDHLMLANLGLLLADFAPLRGPGFYFSFIKLLIIVVAYASWISTADWINRDAEDSRMRPDTWNLIFLSSGIVGLLFLWIMPVFSLGLVIFILSIASAGLTYVSIRNSRVPVSRRVLTERHIKQLLTQYLRIRFAQGRGDVDNAATSLPVKFRTRGEQDEEEDSELLARAAGSKGYRAALQMVHDAVKRRATDIHLEPTRQEMTIRMRIDGALHTGKPYDRSVGEAVVNIFKVLAKMDITEKRKPQDGSLSAEVDGRPVDFRVATAGSVSGEKLVLRILDKSAQLISLKQLGMRDKLREAIKSVVAEPHGMMLVCGPTGAGKSTTLYACLNEIDRYQKNVITLENPVEYQLVNVTQIEVNLKAGKTFASELRSILRQDPDVIMVGEIRDQETAEIACQAAQTGHMVFSTVHANDTVTAVGRLIDLGVQPFVLANALSAILGQRLVRVLCPKCKVRYKPNAELLQRLNLPVDRIKFFYRPPAAKTPGQESDDGEDPKEPCRHCEGAGYLGRTGIFEFLHVTDSLRAMIREKPNLNEIKQEAVKGGMRYLYEDGLMQVIEGRTSIQELLRVAK
jgi:general secretion pathway protein E